MFELKLKIEKEIEQYCKDHGIKCEVCRRKKRNIKDVKRIKSGFFVCIDCFSKIKSINGE